MNQSLVPLFLAFWCVIAIAGSTLDAHQPPDDRFTQSIRFDQSKGIAQVREISFNSPDVSLSGTATFDPIKNLLRIDGTYISNEFYDTKLNLAFQIFDSDKNLIFKEGKRTQFLLKEDVLSTKFNYLLSLQDLGIPEKEDTIYFRFNYIKENVYWADEKFDNLELPAIKISGIENKDPIRVYFSWIPTIIPKSTPVVTYHIFKIGENLYSAQNYRASIEAYYLENRKRDENNRYTLPDETIDNTTYLFAQMRLEKTGRINRRLGFVWDGVRWHNRDEASWRSSWVVPIWQYLLFALVTIFTIVYTIKLSHHSDSTIIKRIGYSFSAIVTVLFLYNFWSYLIIPILFCIFAFFIVSLCLKIEYKTYWILTFFLISQEMVWHTLTPSPTIDLHGTTISVFLAPLLASPLILVSHKPILTVFGNLVLPAIAFVFISSNLYYTFFQDLPTWSILNYASQGLDVTDSIGNLLKDQHNSVGIVLIFFLLLWNYSIFTTPSNTSVSSSNSMS